MTLLSVGKTASAAAAFKGTVVFLGHHRGNKKGGRKGRKRPWPTTTVQVDMDADVRATDSGRASARRARAPALITSAKVM